MKSQRFLSSQHDGLVAPVECCVRSLRPAPGRSPAAWSIILFTTWLAGVGRIDAAQAEPAAAADEQPTIEHYRLELVAFSLDYPKDDPQASNRQFDPGMQLNDAGQVLFTAYWRDFFGQQNTLNLWTAGQVKRIATGGDLLPGYTDIKFAGGLGSRSGNFDESTFNKNGEIWFVGGIVSTSTFPSPPPTPFGKGIFNGNDLDLIAASTAPYAPNPPVAEFFSLDPPYSGNGTKVYSPRTDFHLWLGDNGTGFFQASLDAIELNEFGVPVAAQIFTGGLFTVRGDFKELIAYPNGSAPGFNDFVFRGSLSPLFGLENGSFVSVASVSPRAETNPNNFTKVFYEYRDNLLRLLIKEGDPLPDLPPLSEVLGTTQPYDLKMNLLAVDEKGYSVFDAGASARNFIDGRPLGFWKTTTNGLAKVFRYNEDSPTARGPVRFLPGSVSQRVAMRGGKAVFTTGFTGAGYAAPTPAIFRESTNGFELVAAAGMTVPTTDWRLANDFAVAPIFMNKTNEVAFLAGFIDPTTNRFRRALWVEGRDRYIRRVCYVGQEIEIGGVKRTVSSVGPPPAINKDGVVAFFALFRDGTVAILRGVPPGYQEPREEDTPLRGTTLDIHPIQVVQNPSFGDAEETVPLIAEKSTMVRVFLIWSPPDPTVVRNVTCHLNVDGLKESLTADVYYVKGKTYVIPQGSSADPLGGEYSDVSRLRNAQEAFNFEFPRTQGHHPAGSTSTIEAHLEFEGKSYGDRMDQFALRAAAKTLDISFRTIESIEKPLVKDEAALAAFARTQFDRIVAVYPVPHAQARMYFTAQPTRIAGSLGALSTWILEASFNTPGNEYIDLFVMIAAGKIPDRPNKPGRTGMVEDWAGSGTYGYAPWYLDRTVYVSEDAETFTTSHEYGHKLIGLGHSGESAENGWDVRHYTSRANPYKPQGIAASASGNFQALMWSTANSDGEGWITVGEYMNLVESLTTVRAARPMAFHALAQTPTNILISGEFDTASAVDLNPFILTQTPPSELPSSGPFAVRFLSSAGALLAQMPFGLEPPAPPAVPFINPALPVPDVRNNFFLFVMPFPSDTARIQIVRLQDQTVLAERGVSPNPPAVSVTQLAQINVEPEYEGTISVADKDGDSLQYVISYTPDAANHIPLNVQWIEANRRFRFSGKSLPGSNQGRVRVLVTDGVLSADAYSPAAAFPNQKPLVSILEPMPDSIFAENAPISFRGVAYDAEDGILSGSTLEWRLDNTASPVGMDERLMFPSLPLGEHTVILRATDSAGVAQETLIRITVVPINQLFVALQKDTGDAVLQWTGGNALQSAPRVTGPWLDVNGASSPYFVPTDQPATFYRVRP